MPSSIDPPPASNRLTRDWESQRFQRVGERFTMAGAVAIQPIEQAPESCAVRIGNYRHRSVRGFPYTLVFRTRSADPVVIADVGQGRRRPGYWRRRS